MNERDITPENENELLMNTPERLSLEATMINQNFTQQILRSSKYRTKFDLPNPVSGITTLRHLACMHWFAH